MLKKLQCSWKSIFLDFCKLCSPITDKLISLQACENGPSFLISVGEPLGDHLDNFIKMNVNEDLIEEDEDVDEVQVEKKDVEREKSRFVFEMSFFQASDWQNDQL